MNTPETVTLTEAVTSLTAALLAVGKVLERIQAELVWTNNAKSPTYTLAEGGPSQNGVHKPRTE